MVIVWQDGDVANTMVVIIFQYTNVSNQHIVHFIFTHYMLIQFSSVQFTPVARSCPTLCDPMNCSMPGLPVHHQLPESTQNHVQCVGDAIQPYEAFTVSQLQLFAFHCNSKK